MPRAGAGPTGPPDPRPPASAPSMPMTVRAGPTGRGHSFQVLPFLYLALTVGSPPVSETGPGCIPFRPRTVSGPRCRPVVGTGCGDYWPCCSPSWLVLVALLTLAV